MTRLLAPYLIGAVIFASIVGALIYIGISFERDRRALDAAKDYIEGTEDARDATSDLPVDDSDAVEWLRDFAK